MQLTELSDDALLSQLAAICLEGHRLTARLVVCLIEVEERRLDLKAACTSMFDFCVRRLGMSEGAAFRHINASRLVKRFPWLLARLESGELRLSALALLRQHLMKRDDAGAAELANAVAGKTHREVEHLLARIAPKPDVPSAIVEIRDAAQQGELLGGGTSAAFAKPHAPSLARIAPLSESRFKVQFTAGEALCDKLERARDLMSHANPSGDLAVVVERALDLLLDRLEKDRLAKATRPGRRAATTTHDARATRDISRARRAIPRAVRREVFERDGETCAFIDAEGRRCGSRVRLELDHVESHALGGADDATNLRVRCRAHNRLHAEEVFGKEHVARAVDIRQRTSRDVVVDFRQRKSTGAARESNAAVRSTLDIAVRGLVGLGFAKSDARRAVDAIARRPSAEGETLPIEQILREAIGSLT